MTVVDVNGREAADWDTALIAAGYVDGRGSNRASWRQLALELGVHQSTLAGMRDGTRDTAQGTVDAVARALRLSPITVADWVGRARTERQPYRPHEDANLLTQDERAAVNRIIALLAAPKKRGQFDAGNAEAEKIATSSQGDLGLAARQGSSDVDRYRQSIASVGEDNQDEGEHHGV